MDNMAKAADLLVIKKTNSKSPCVSNPQPRHSLIIPPRPQSISGLNQYLSYVAVLESTQEKEVVLSDSSSYNLQLPNSLESHPWLEIEACGTGHETQTMPKRPLSMLKASRSFAQIPISISAMRTGTSSPTSPSSSPQPLHGCLRGSSSIQNLNLLNSPKGQAVLEDPSENKNVQSVYIHIYTGQ
jgi:hypothetical protein